MLLNEVNKKLYFIHSPDIDSNFTIHESRIEIEKMLDGSRKVTKAHSIRLFLGHLRSPRSCEVIVVNWFMNQFDGSIFQINSSIRNQSDTLTIFTLLWIKLDDGMGVDDSAIEYSGEVKMMAKDKFEFPQFSGLDQQECGILFSHDGKKLLMRFRIRNPDSFDSSQSVPPLFDLPRVAARARELITSVGSSITHEMSKPPTYALFALNYDTHHIQLLTQFVPNSQENHANLLISTKLLPVYAERIGFPNSKAQSYLSQRSLMIGQFLKYTFFSTINKGVIGVVAVKSLMKTLQSGQWSLTPKKLWFPLEDDKVKTAFEMLPEKIIEWQMLAQKGNAMLIVGNEFILQVYHPDAVEKPLKQLGTIRVKLGVEYKDYRKCAGCGKMETHKGRSKNGKRISQFKVCGWCKDHNVHKTLEVACHYCCEECADNHWPIHQLEHNVKEKGKKGKGKKSNGKKKKNKK